MRDGRLGIAQKFFGTRGMTDDPWTAHVPKLFRALADPMERVNVPQPANAGLDHACSTWGALHYSLTCLLGWRDVARGLAWWYAAGQPVGDSRVLDLVKRVWGQDDQIDYYAAWAWKPAGSGWALPQQYDPVGGPSPTQLGQTSGYPNEDWWRSFVRRGMDHHHDPFYGGSDALHLEGRFDLDPSNAPSRDALLHQDIEQRRAVMVTGGIQHWLADLDQAESRLLPIGPRSWHVEVFDRTVGYLGEYRKSRVTGLWFQGKHSIHMRGAQEKT